MNRFLGGYGGIGRRAGFRFLWRDPCGFDPHYPYQGYPPAKCGHPTRDGRTFLPFTLFKPGLFRIFCTQHDYLPLTAKKGCRFRGNPFSIGCVLISWMGQAINTCRRPCHRQQRELQERAL